MLLPAVPKLHRVLPKEEPQAASVGPGPRPRLRAVGQPDGGDAPERQAAQAQPRGGEGARGQAQRGLVQGPEALKLVQGSRALKARRVV